MNHATSRLWASRALQAAPPRYLGLKKKFFLNLAFMGIFSSLSLIHSIREILKKVGDLVKWGERKTKMTKCANLLGYLMIILLGIVMAVGALLKILGFFDFSSDWFWFFVGIGLVIEGTISLIKQKRFDRKYKIIERSEAEKIKETA